MGAVTPSGEMYCYGCQQFKRLDAFGIARGTKTGRQSRCRACRKIQAAERSEHIAAYQQRYRMANREHLLAEKKKWYHANRETLLARDREKYLANREAKLAYAKAYAKANRSLFNAWTRQRRARQHLATIAPITRAALGQKWGYWGGRCWICGGAADTWDHVKPLAKGGAHCLANLRPACKSCNCSKRAKWPFAVVA